MQGGHRGEACVSARVLTDVISSRFLGLGIISILCRRWRPRKWWDSGIISFLFHITYLFACVHTHVPVPCHSTCVMCAGQRTTWESVLSTHHVGAGDWIRSPGLAISALSTDPSPWFWRIGFLGLWSQPECRREQWGWTQWINGKTSFWILFISQCPQFSLFSSIAA